MDISIIVQQMSIMLFFILIGCFSFRKGTLSELSSRHLSGLVVNFCNPALLICSSFTDGPKASLPQLGTACLVTVSVYLMLIAAGQLIPRLLRVEKEKFFVYRLLNIYANVGFLGIPLISAVLGSEALIYISINCLIFNILFYTDALSTIRRKAGISTPAGFRSTFSKIVNVGTVSAVLTIFFYLGNFPIPGFLRNTFTYAGQCTTFLSMLVLGVAVAQIPVRDMFCHGKDYLFIALRMVVLPVCCILVLKRLISDPLLLGTTSLLLAVPCASMPLMSARECGLDAEEMPRLIVLTTLVSVVTIPVVALFI